MTGGRIGKLYTIKSWQQCVDEGVDFIPLPLGPAWHMVVVTSRPDSQRNVKCVTVSKFQVAQSLISSTLMTTDNVETVRRGGAILLDWR